MTIVTAAISPADFPEFVAFHYVYSLNKYPISADLLRNWMNPLYP
jgi:hypothetical protein